jgi:PPOX class probable F420-dependent enzyme
MSQSPTPTGEAPCPALNLRAAARSFRTSSTTSWTTTRPATSALCAPTGEISITPLALLFDGTTIRLSTTTDRKKYRNLRADPRVALCVPHRNNPNRYVEVRGSARLVADADRSFINAVAKKYMDVDEYPFDPPGTERVTIEIEVRQVSSPRIWLAEENPNGPDPRS